MTYVSVEVGIDEFSDSDIQEECVGRGLDHGAPHDPLSALEVIKPHIDQADYERLRRILNSPPVDHRALERWIAACGIQEAV